jgi:hypothetical protein
MVFALLCQDMLMHRYILQNLTSAQLTLVLVDVTVVSALLLVAVIVVPDKPCIQRHCCIL